MALLICGIYKKKDTNEFIYKTEIDPQTQKTNMVTKGEGDKLGVWDEHIHTTNYIEFSTKNHILQ